MRIHHRRRGGFQKKIEQPIYRANESILVPEVRVIDDEGHMLGTLATSEAMRQAKERG